MSSLYRRSRAVFSEPKELGLLMVKSNFETFRIIVLADDSRYSCFWLVTAFF
jgi:hypothetical protein